MGIVLLPFKELSRVSSALSAATAGATESTSTVVIGSGLSGLAVASELSRKGIETIVVSGQGPLSGDCSIRRGSPDPALMNERADLLRLLRTYARNHAIDIRVETHAADLHQLTTGSSGDGGCGAGGRTWAVQTEHGVLLTPSIVLTNCRQNQIRRMLKSMGIAAGRDFLVAMRDVGVHLVGIGGLLAPTTREIVHQAKLVSEAIVSERLATAKQAIA